MKVKKPSSVITRPEIPAPIGLGRWKSGPPTVQAPDPPSPTANHGIPGFRSSTDGATTSFLATTGLVGNGARTQNTTVETLEQFYALMDETRQLRCQIVADHLTNKRGGRMVGEQLERAWALLRAIPASDGGVLLRIGDKDRIAIELTYEVGELEKDLVFLREGEKALIHKLASASPTIKPQVAAGTMALSGTKFRNFIADRDGTVNNYCGRYLSSVQSAYNAVFLTRFARKVKDPVILTSAPLRYGGLTDISTMPRGAFHCCGSNGREYIDIHGNLGALEIQEDRAKMLEKLNQRLEWMLSEPARKRFALIGSGFQRKFGQSTVARQDSANSIPDRESEAMLKSIERIVDEIDPQRQFFAISDTGKDVEIALTISNRGSSEGFDKGHGVHFLDERLSLGVAEGPNLVCGDTSSDLPMLEACCSKSPETTRAVFVTTDEELKERVRTICPRAIFVDCPDALVLILECLSRS